jgi:hypothetical protein
MSRYPYTEAYDAIRERITWKGVEGVTPCVLSRSDAAQIVKYISEALGMDNQTPAEKIADHARKHSGCVQCGASTVDSCNAAGCFFLEGGNGAPT